MENPEYYADSFFEEDFEVTTSNFGENESGGFEVNTSIFEENKEDFDASSATSEYELSYFDSSEIVGKLDSIQLILAALLIVAGMIFGSCIFRHFRK